MRRKAMMSKIYQGLMFHFTCFQEMNSGKTFTCILKCTPMLHSEIILRSRRAKKLKFFHVSITFLITPYLVRLTLYCLLVKLLYSGETRLPKYFRGCVIYCSGMYSRAGIFKNSMGARHRLGRGVIVPARQAT
jgi:hypothetical protein